ncbi:MAG: GGDEF domain-containing protein [Woeseia sp.]
MLQLFHRLLSQRSAASIASLSLALILLLGAIDLLTGYEISFSVFYLIPIAIAVWYGNGKLGYAASIVSALAWLTVEASTAQPYSRDWILFWNAGVRLMSFAIFVYLAAQLKINLHREQQLARTDSLTGLLNRAGFMDQAGAIVNAATRYEQAVTIAYIDLDRFKAVNDTLGHSVGDEVLDAIGKVLGVSSRKSDIAGRIGGDEFALVLPSTDLSGANAYFENLHYLLENEIKNRQWSGLGVSIGVAVFERGPASLSEGLQVADRLMYRAKKSGQPRLIVERFRRGGTAETRT